MFKNDIVVIVFCSHFTNYFFFIYMSQLKKLYLLLLIVFVDENSTIKFNEDDTSFFD